MFKFTSDEDEIIKAINAEITGLANSLNFKCLTLGHNIVIYNANSYSIDNHVTLSPFKDDDNLTFSVIYKSKSVLVTKLADPGSFEKIHMTVKKCCENLC